MALASVIECRSDSSPFNTPIMIVDRSSPLSNTSNAVTFIMSRSKRVAAKSGSAVNTLKPFLSEGFRTHCFTEVLYSYEHKTQQACEFANEVVRAAATLVDVAIAV